MITGEGASYSITVSNLGNTTAKNVVLVDTLPAEVSFVNSTPAPTTGSDNVLTYNLGDLTPGASVAITVNVSVIATEGTATNNVSVTTDSAEGGEGTANNSDSCSSNILAPELTLQKTATVTALTQSFTNQIDATMATGDNPQPYQLVLDNVIIGSEIVYTLTVSNTGDAAAKDIVLADTLPSGVTIVDNPDGGTISGNKKGKGRENRSFPF
jgi:uncharacterized repeat protein (TIGR01451 family)